MRKRFLVILVLLLAVLMCCPAAFSEHQLELSSDCVPVEGILDFTVTGGSGQPYRYTMRRGNKKLFETETEYGFGSYLPRETGTYTLEVSTGEKGVNFSSSAEFTVVEKLSLHHEALPASLSVGGAVEVALTAKGGTPPYQYAYAVMEDGQILTEQSGGNRWSWAPIRAGTFLLHMAVVDSKGAVATLRHPLIVEANQGIGLRYNGGALMGMGGQKSWMVMAGEPWTAETTDDFFRIDTPSGQPGDSLVVTVQSPTDEYREGSVLITSGNHQLTWPVTQSAQMGVDEEVYLFSQKENLLVEGGEHALWTDASGSRSFTVSPVDAVWDVAVDGDFIETKIAGNRLTVTVGESDSGAVRSGLITLLSPEGSAYLHVFQAPGQPVSGKTSSVNISWEDVPIFSQFSGLWKNAGYGVSTLEHSGCAVFALSHAMTWLGIDKAETAPAALAKKYAFCLRDGGTINSTLVGNAGDDLGFKTRFDLFTDVRTIRSRLEDGAVFSFSVVSGHIALVVDKSEDGSMMRIIDSAPSATWERIKGAKLYRQVDGEFIPIDSLTEIEGIRYYVENDAFGGATYWLEDSYVARRGVRLIQLETE